MDDNNSKASTIEIKLKTLIKNRKEKKLEQTITQTKKNPKDATKQINNEIEKVATQRRPVKKQPQTVETPTENHKTIDQKQTQKTPMLKICFYAIGYTMLFYALISLAIFIFINN